MNYPSYDANHLRDRYNEMLREAEQYRRMQVLQAQQPNLFDHLKSQLAALADLARPQRNRVNRV